jgi:hypothetical protein
MQDANQPSARGSGDGGFSLGIDPGDGESDPPLSTVFRFSAKPAATLPL